jgi:hypothetical protein
VEPLVLGTVFPFISYSQPAFYALSYTSPFPVLLLYVHDTIHGSYFQVPAKALTVHWPGVLKTQTRRSQRQRFDYLGQIRGWFSRIVIPITKHERFLHPKPTLFILVSIISNMDSSCYRGYHNKTFSAKRTDLPLCLCPGAVLMFLIYFQSVKRLRFALCFCRMVVVADSSHLLSATNQTFHSNKNHCHSG